MFAVMGRVAVVVYEKVGRRLGLSAGVFTLGGAGVVLQVSPRRPWLFGPGASDPTIAS